MTKTLLHVGAVATLTMLCVGCSPYQVLPSSSSTTPTAPTPTPSSQPTLAGGQWNLTTTLSAATGPAGCVVDISHFHVGDSYRSWVLEVQRSGQAAHLVYFDFFNPSDRYEFDGAVVGGVLEVPLRTGSSAGYCGQKGGRVEFSFEGYVSGRFSEDGSTLTAEEFQSLRLTSGEAITFHYDWVARKAN